MVEAGFEGGQVDPQLGGGLLHVRRPGEGLTEPLEADQLAGDGRVDLFLFAGGEDRVGGDGAAADVFDLVGDGAAPFGLQEPTVEGDRLVVEVGDADEVEG